MDVMDASTHRRNINKNTFDSKLSQCEFSISSYENLIQEWTKFRNSYPDIIEPLLSNITEFLYGLKLKVSLFKKNIIEYECNMMEIAIQHDILNFIKFPVLDDTQNDFEKYLKLFSSKKMNTFVQKMFHNPENAYITSQAVFRYVGAMFIFYYFNILFFRLWKCGMFETYNLCILDGKMHDYLNKTNFIKFTDLIHSFVCSWNKQQEEKEQKHREAESLYKIK